MLKERATPPGSDVICFYFYKRVIPSGSFFFVNIISVNDNNNQINNSENDNIFGILCESRRDGIVIENEFNNQPNPEGVILFRDIM